MLYLATFDMDQLEGLLCYPIKMRFSSAYTRVFSRATAILKARREGPGDEVGQMLATSRFQSTTKL